MCHIHLRTVLSIQFVLPQFKLFRTVFIYAKPIFLYFQTRQCKFNSFSITYHANLIFKRRIRILIDVFWSNDLIRSKIRSRHDACRNTGRKAPHPACDDSSIRKTRQQKNFTGETGAAFLFPDVCDADKKSALNNRFFALFLSAVNAKVVL